MKKLILLILFLMIPMACAVSFQDIVSNVSSVKWNNYIGLNITMTPIAWYNESLTLLMVLQLKQKDK